MGRSGAALEELSSHGLVVVRTLFIADWYTLGHSGIPGPFRALAEQT